MADKEEKFPEVGEFVVGTVQSIFRQGAFIELDEYPGRKGMLHLSEISLKWVRNIRDYVKEGQKVVVLVLKVDTHKDHVDLSLRRVTDTQRKEKLQEVKQSQRAEKLLELLAKELGAKPGEIGAKIAEPLRTEYGSIYAGLEAIAADPARADAIKLSASWKKKLLEVVQKNVKSPFVEVTGYVELTSYESDGVDHVKKTLQTIQSHKTDGEINVSYIGAPYYRVTVKASSYKGAEKTLKGAVETGFSGFQKKGGVAEFHREMPEKAK